MASKGLGGIESNDKPKRRGTFVARYGGRCGVCDDEIDVGDDCCYDEDEVCHLECVE